MFELIRRPWELVLGKETFENKRPGIIPGNKFKLGQEGSGSELWEITSVSPSCLFMRVNPGESHPSLGCSIIASDLAVKQRGERPVAKVSSNWGKESYLIFGFHLNQLGIPSPSFQFVEDRGEAKYLSRSKRSWLPQIPIYSLVSMQLTSTQEIQRDLMKELNYAEKRIRDGEAEFEAALAVFFGTIYAVYEIGNFPDPVGALALMSIAGIAMSYLMLKSKEEYSIAAGRLESPLIRQYARLHINL